MEEPTIESGVKPPKLRMSKAEREEARKKKAFEEYAYWYQRVHVRSPKLLRIYESNGYLDIDVLQNAVSEKRLKVLTGMLKDRSKNR